MQGLLQSDEAVPTPTRAPYVIADIAIPRISLEIRVTRAMYIGWVIGKIVASHAGVSGQGAVHFRVASQTLSAYAKDRQPTEADSLTLPAITLAGSMQSTPRGPQMSADVGLGYFSGEMQPATLKELLDLYQNLVKDVADTLEQSIRAIKLHLASSATPAPQIPDSGLPICLNADPGVKMPRIVDLRLTVAGARLALRASDLPTTLLFEFESISGRASNATAPDAPLQWDVKAQKLALALGHLDANQVMAENITQSRFAHMDIDIEAFERPEKSDGSRSVGIAVRRVQSTINVAALGELSSLLRSWSAGYHNIRQERAGVLKDVRNDTRRMMEQIPYEKVKPITWLAARTLQVDINNVAIAMPLVEMSSQLSDEAGTTVPALLLSIVRIIAQTKKGESARLEIKDVALQLLHE